MRIGTQSMTVRAVSVTTHKQGERSTFPVRVARSEHPARPSQTSAVTPTDSRSSRDRFTSSPHAKPPSVPSERSTR